MSHRRWIIGTRVASVAGLATFALAIVLAPPGSRVESFFDTWFYNGLMVLGCVVVGSRALLVPSERPAWTAFTAAFVSWTFAEFWYAAANPQTYPSVADVGYLGFYPLVYLGIVALVRARARSIGGTLWLDGFMASLAAATFAAAILVEVVLHSTEGPTSTVATNLAYPLGDLLLLSAVFGVFSLTRWRPGRRWLLLGLGVLATAIADAIYLFQSAADTYVEGSWLDILWPAALLLIASSAWAVDRSRPEFGGKTLFAVPLACAVLAIGVLVYDHFDRVNLLAVGLATATLLAVVVRLAMTFRENRRLFELTRLESVTDALTGLGNRRKLLSDLERLFAEPEVEPTLLMIFDLDGFKGYNDTFGHPAGDALLARLGSKLAAVPTVEHGAYRLGGDEFCLVVPLVEGEAEPVIDQACAALSERGVGFEIGSSFGAVLLPEEAVDASNALHVADERLYAQKHSRRIETDRTMDALLEALSLREPDLPMHLDSVGSLAIETGLKLGLRRDELDELVRAAQLHDLGKLAVPDEILHKAGPLDEREWAFVRQHPLVGERILRASPAFRNVATIVRSTHERWDGAGYPDGFAGHEIPVASRIISACDAFTAMTSARPYRAALSTEEAIAELERVAGTQFDPAVVSVLAAHVRDDLPAEHAEVRTAEHPAQHPSEHTA
ncbi:MAG: diguanylate cyclase [Actinomycetota bacterium]|nr:diguanylate cyclase [Actinomycetota bacterium]